MPGNLLIFSQRFPPSVGGTPTVMRKLCSALPPDRLAVISMAEPGENGAQTWAMPFPQRRLAQPCRLIRALDRGRFSTAPWIARRAAGLTRRSDTAAVVAVFPTETFLVAAWLLARWWRMPLYVYMLDLWADNRGDRQRRLVSRRMEPRIFRDAVRVFGPNPMLCDYFRGKYPAAALELLPHIVEAKASPVGRGQRAWKRAGETLIVYTGQLYSTTGDPVRNLVRALELVEDLNPRVVISTPDTQRQIARYGLAGHARIETVCLDTADEVADLQGQADILFNTVAFDHADSLQVKTLFPTKTIEYLVADRPMIVHGPAGNPFVEYARERGFAEIVDRKDPRRLADVIRRLISEPEPPGRAAARRAELEGRDPATVARQFLEAMGARHSRPVSPRLAEQ